MLGCAGPWVSTATSHLGHHGAIYTNGLSCVPIKVYLQEEAVGWVEPEGSKVLIPDLSG